jgi:hypothetical protein
MKFAGALVGLIVFSIPPTPAFSQSANQNCSNSVQGNNNAPLTNNCPTIYLAPPPLRNMIYQYGREIANTDAPLRVNGDGKCSIDEIYNTKLEAIDIGKPMKYGDYSFIITKWVPWAMAEATSRGMHTNVMHDIECKITN